MSKGPTSPRPGPVFPNVVAEVPGGPLENQDHEEPTQGGHGDGKKKTAGVRLTVNPVYQEGKEHGTGEKEV